MLLIWSNDKTTPTVSPASQKSNSRTDPLYGYCTPQTSCRDTILWLYFIFPLHVFLQNWSCLTLTRPIDRDIPCPFRQRIHWQRRQVLIFHPFPLFATWTHGYPPFFACTPHPYCLRRLLDLLISRSIIR